MGEYMAMFLGKSCIPTTTGIPSLFTSHMTASETNDRLCICTISGCSSVMTFLI
jgi:hypothetical protein